MSYFEAKMHQILFQLGSAPDPTGELTHPFVGFQGHASKGKRKREGVGARRG